MDGTSEKTPWRHHVIDLTPARSLGYRPTIIDRLSRRRMNLLKDLAWYQEAFRNHIDEIDAADAEVRRLKRLLSSATQKGQSGSRGVE